MHLPDINFWLALTFGSHVHHPAAKSWFDALPNNAVCFFCRTTQQGFMRLATNSKVFGPQAVTLANAWLAFDTLLSDPRVAYAEEPADIETHWRAFTQHHSFSPHIWNDAYLAAFAQAAALQFVTFDKAFSQYANIACTILS